MGKALTALADRMVSLVVPRTTAGACACFGETVYRCNVCTYEQCQLSCRCDVINCRPIGACGPC